jgi:hypothetical protein
LPLLLIKGWDYPAWQLIIIYGSFMLLSIVLQLFVFGRVINRVRDIRNFVTFVCFVGCALVFVIPVVNDFYYALFMMLGVAICIMVNPTLAVMATFVSRGKHGTILGLRNSFGSLARALSPLINGFLYDIVFPPIYPSKTPHVVPFILCSFTLLITGIIIRFADEQHAVDRNKTEEVEENQGDGEKTVEVVVDETTKLIN